MTSRFSELAIDAHDLRKLADFWCAVLDYKIIEERDDVIEIGPEELPEGWGAEFLEAWNDDPQPFVWTATVDSILEKLSRCRRTLEQIQPGCTQPRSRKRRNQLSS